MLKLVYNHNKVAYIGLNSVFGRVVTSLLKQSSAISNLIVYDDKHAEGPLQEYPNNSSDQCKITRICGREKLPLALSKADIVVIGEEFFDGKGSTNSKENLAAIGLRAAEYAKMIATFSPNAILVVAASPLNILLPVYARVLDDAGCFKPNRLLGATSADTLRASPLMAAKLNIKSQMAILPVIGGSSASTRVPLFSQAHPARAKELDKDTQTDIITKIKKFDDPDCGEQVVDRAYATVRFIHSIITAIINNIAVPEIALTRTDQVPEVPYFSLPVLLGKHGVDKIMTLPKLWKFEDELLKAAIENLQKDVQLSLNILEESNRQTDKLQSKETSSEIANTSGKSLEERHEKSARYEQGLKYGETSAKNDLKIDGSKSRKSLTSSQKSEEQSYAWDSKRDLTKTTSEMVESINRKKTLTNQISQNDSSRSRDNTAEVKRPKAILSLEEEEEMYSVPSCQPPDNYIKEDANYKSLEVNEQEKVNIEHKLDTLDQESKMLDSTSLRDSIIIGESLLNTDCQNIIKHKTKLLMEDLERDLALFDDDDSVVIIETNVSRTKGSQISESNGVLLDNAVNVLVVEHTCNNDGKISDELTEFHVDDKPKMSAESKKDGKNDFQEQKEEKKIQISSENLTTKMATRPKVEKSIPTKECNEKNTICVKNSPLGKNNLNTINLPVAKENKSIASYMKLKEQRFKIPSMPKSQLIQNSKDGLKKKLVNINIKRVENSKNNIVAYPTGYPKGNSSINNYENKSRTPELTLKPKPLVNLGNASKTKSHVNLKVVPKEVKKHNEGNTILESIKLNMKKQAKFLKSRTDFSAAELNNSSKSGSLADFKESDMIKNTNKQNLIQDPVPSEKKTKIIREKVPEQLISNTLAGVNKSLNSESKSSGNLNSVAPSTSKLLALSPNIPLQLNNQNGDINQTSSTTGNIKKENSESVKTEKSKEVESSTTSLTSIKNVKDSEFDKSKLAESPKSQKAPIENETVSTKKQENLVKEQKLVPENANSNIKNDRKSLITKSLALKTEKEMLDSPVKSTNVVEQKNEDKNNQREKILPKKNANNSELSVRAPRNKQHFRKPFLRPGRAVSMGSLNTDWTKKKSIPFKISYSDNLKSKSMKNDISFKSNSDLKAHNDSEPQSENNEVVVKSFQKSGINYKQSYYSRKAIQAMKLKAKQRRTSLKNEGNQLENDSVSIEKLGKPLEEQNGKSDLLNAPKVNDIPDDSIERNKGLDTNHKNKLKKSKNLSLKSKLPEIVLETKMENEGQTPADGVTKVEKCLKTDSKKVLTCDNKNQSSPTIEKQNDKAISTIVNSSKIPQIFHPKFDVASLNPKVEKQSNDILVEIIPNKTISEAPLKSASNSNHSIALDKNEVNTAHRFTKGNFPGCDSNLKELVIMNLTDAANKIETIIKPSTASNPFPAWETISEDYIPYSSILNPIKMPTSLPNKSILLETSNKTETEVVVPGNVPQPKLDGNTKIEKPKTVEANIEKEKLSFEKPSSSYFHQNNVKLNHESSVAVKDLEEITRKIKTQQIFLSEAGISKEKSLPDSASIVDTSNLSTIKPTINNKVKTPIVNTSLQNSQITSSSSKNVIDNTKPIDQTVGNSIEPDKSMKLQSEKLYQDNKLKEKALPKSPGKSINKVALLNDVNKFKAAKESVKLHKPLNADSLKKFKAEALKNTTLKTESTEVKVSDVSTSDSKFFKRNRLFFSLNGNKKGNSKKSIKESTDRNFSDIDLLKAEASKRINYSIRAKGSANVENYKLNQTTEPELGNQKSAHNKTIEVITKKNLPSNNDSYKGLLHKLKTNLKTPIDTGNRANDVFNSTKSHRMQKYVDSSQNDKPKLRASDATSRARKYMQMVSKSKKHGHIAATDENAMPSSAANKNGDNSVKLSIQRVREQLLAGEKMLAFSTTNVTNENKKGQIPDRETIENKKKLLHVAKKAMFSTEKIASLVNTKDMTQQTFANRRSSAKPYDISIGNPLIDEKLKSKHNLDDGLKEQTKTVIKPKSTQNKQYGMLNQLSQGSSTNTQNNRAQKKVPMPKSITNIYLNRKANNGKEKVFKKPHFISSTAKESSTNPYSYNNRGLYSNTNYVHDYLAHKLRAQEIDKLSPSSLHSIQPSSSSESFLKANSKKKPTTITRALSEGSNLFVNRNNINDRPPMRTRSTKSYPGYREHLNIPHKFNSTGTIAMCSKKSTNAIKSSKSFTVKANKNKSQPYCFKPFVAAVINKMKYGSEEKPPPNIPNGDDKLNNETNRRWGRLSNIFKPKDLEIEADGRIKRMPNVQDSKHDLHTDYSYEGDGRISNLKENKNKLKEFFLGRSTSVKDVLENPIEKPTNVVDYFVHRDSTNV